MAIMSLRSRSHVKASMVITRADHLFIHNYIRSLLNIILRPILMVNTGFEHAQRISRSLSGPHILLLVYLTPYKVIAN